MRTRIALAAASLIALSFVARPASAQGTKTICNDGTTSEAVGRGACSSHGGVKTMGTKSATKAAKSEAKAAEKTAEKTAKTETKAAEKTAKTETKAAVKTAKTETKAVEKKAKAAPKEVTCTDGTMSKPGRGACSGHGGVKKG
ncbi:MAG TPA: hypothetical protein VI259_07495 [Gemmatimonadaceae bacterium]